MSIINFILFNSFHVLLIQFKMPQKSSAKSDNYRGKTLDMVLTA